MIATGSTDSKNPECSLCGGPHPFDTTVPSVVWNAVIRDNNLPDYLCATCVLREFVKQGVSFTAILTGDELHGVPIEVQVNTKPARDAMRISAENTALRARLRKGGLF